MTAGGEGRDESIFDAGCGDGLFGRRIHSGLSSPPIIASGVTRYLILSAKFFLSLVRRERIGAAFCEEMQAAPKFPSGNLFLTICPLLAQFSWKSESIGLD